MAGPQVFGQASALADHPKTTFIDLPDVVYGLIFSHLNAAARHALYRSCRALRTSPSVNAQLSSLKVNLFWTPADLQPSEACRQLCTWPARAQLRSLALPLGPPAFHAFGRELLKAALASPRLLSLVRGIQRMELGNPVVSGIQQQADGEGAAGALSFLAQYCASLSVLVLTRSHLWLTSPTFPRLADLAGLHTLELRLCDLTAPMMPSSGYGGGSSGGGAAGGSTWGSGSNSNNGSSGGAGGAGGPGADALRALAQLQSLQVLVLEAWGSPIKQLDLGPLAALHQLRSFSLSAAPVGLVTGWQALAAGATRLHTLALHQVPVLTHTQAQLWDPYASSHPAASSSAAAGATAAGSAGLARPPASGAGGTAGGASAGPGPSAGSGSSSSAPAWQQGEHGQQQGQGQQGPGQQQQLEPCGWPSLRVLRAELMIPAQVLGFLQGQDMPVLAEVHLRSAQLVPADPDLCRAALARLASELARRPAAAVRCLRLLCDEWQGIGAAVQAVQPLAQHRQLRHLDFRGGVVAPGDLASLARTAPALEELRVAARRAPSCCVPEAVAGLPHLRLFHVPELEAWSRESERLRRRAAAEAQGTGRRRAAAAAAAGGRAGAGGGQRGEGGHEDDEDDDDDEEEEEGQGEDAGAPGSGAAPAAGAGGHVRPAASGVSGGSSPGGSSGASSGGPVSPSEEGALSWRLNMEEGGGGGGVVTGALAAAGGIWSAAAKQRKQSRLKALLATTDEDILAACEAAQRDPRRTEVLELEVEPWSVARLQAAWDARWARMQQPRQQGLRPGDEPPAAGEGEEGQGRGGEGCAFGGVGPGVGPRRVKLVAWRYPEEKKL